MKKVTIIEFNPQDEDDTIKAITSEESLLLKPSSNLIATDCLELLTKNKFYLYKDWEYGYLFRKNK